MTSIKSIKLPNQIELQYVEQGNPSGIPLILLHGITDSWRSFELILPHLPESIHAFALSQRGHGDSTRPETGYHPRDFAADVVAFMDAQKIRQAVIAGHSMGSYITQRFVLDYPERTLGIALVGSCTNMQDNEGVAEFQLAVSTLTDPVDPGFALEFQQSTMTRPVPQTFLDTVVAESLKLPARVWQSSLEGLLETSHREELSKIKVPTLIIWGNRDAFFPRSEQEGLAAGIANSRFLEYEETGHAPHWEEPGRFAADIVSFIENIKTRKAA
jgi:pimeloyl-ACP methyl ester carboxylesterase